MADSLQQFCFKVDLRSSSPHFFGESHPLLPSSWLLFSIPIFNHAIQPATYSLHIPLFYIKQRCNLDTCAWIWQLYLNSLHFITYFHEYKWQETSLDVKHSCHYSFHFCQCLTVWKLMHIRITLILFDHICKDYFDLNPKNTSISNQMF